MIEIIPTNTCPPDFTELTARSKFFSEFATCIQLDAADGVFVPATSWPYFAGQSAELDALIQAGKGFPYSDILTYEVHIMAQTPQETGEKFARAGIQRVIGHVEAFAGAEEVRDALAAWKKAAAREVGLAVLLDTPVAAFEPFLPLCDVVQLMSIAKLGYQGAAFEPGIYERIKEVRALHPHLVIEIDGGVSASNIAELAAAGASRFGVGSAITKAEHPKAAYENLKSLAERAQKVG